MEMEMERLREKEYEYEHQKETEINEVKIQENNSLRIGELFTTEPDPYHGSIQFTYELEILNSLGKQHPNFEKIYEPIVNRFNDFTEKSEYFPTIVGKYLGIKDKNLLNNKFELHKLFNLCDQLDFIISPIHMVDINLMKSMAQNENEDVLINNTLDIINKNKNKMNYFIVYPMKYFNFSKYIKMGNQSIDRNTRFPERMKNLASMIRIQTPLLRGICNKLNDHDEKINALEENVSNMKYEIEGIQDSIDETNDRLDQLIEDLPLIIADTSKIVNLAIELGEEPSEILKLPEDKLRKKVKQLKRIKRLRDDPMIFQCSKEDLFENQSVYMMCTWGSEIPKEILAMNKINTKPMIVDPVTGSTKVDKNKLKIFKTNFIDKTIVYELINNKKYKVNYRVMTHEECDLTPIDLEQINLLKRIHNLKFKTK